MKKLNPIKTSIWIKNHKGTILIIIFTVLLVVLLHTPVWSLLPKMKDWLPTIKKNEKVIQTQKQTIKNLQEKNEKI